MALRLTIVGAVLIIGGLINISGLRMVTLPLGAIALVAGGVLWLVRNRNSPSR
ncbi:hypothetical protein ACIBQ1_59895 [Nonomuraea sp. NPDC050153]|uniref:hypothetical protein n=1 Tax=Nonomuraea sp. NPDC050153 TaxID=3364359 RepID=UPI0037A86255